LRVGAAHRAGTSLAVILLLFAPFAHAGAGAAIRYRAEAIEGAGSATRLRVELGREGFLSMLKINRVDETHAMQADTLVVPDPGSDLLELSPWPAALPGGDSARKLLMVSLRTQAFAAYENGKLVRWGPVCSGGPSSPTRAGRFSVNWKAAFHISSVDSSWIMPWTVNIDSSVGTALHHYALPGRPASHCCIRLMVDDAQWIYEWVDAWTLAPDGETVFAPGTPVIIFGDYDYDAASPWRLLPSNPNATAVSPEEIESAYPLSAR
jgi:hypothetical protein